MWTDSTLSQHRPFPYLKDLGFSDGMDPFCASANENRRFAAEQSKWLARQFSALRGLRPLMVSTRHRLKRQRRTLAEANRHLAATVATLRQSAQVQTPAGTMDCSYHVDGDDEELRQTAERMAQQCIWLFAKDSDPADDVLRLLDACGIEPQRLRHCDSSKPWNWQQRSMCARWWLRQLRVVAARRAEQVARDLHAVNKVHAPYASSYTMHRWRARQIANGEILASLKVTNSDGQSFTLQEIADRGQANPVIRRHELMIRIRGFEEYATAEGHAAHFITVTCPSRFHQYSGLQPNPTYNGATPRDAADYLQTMWARCRAALHRAGVEFYGFRIAEPHHDGCPHWHLLLFTDQKHSTALRATLRAYALQDSPDEPGAAEHRFTAVEISASKGTAAGYVAKYVSKNVDGYAVGRDDDAGANATATAPRVRAWASTWGIRQFQQLGGPAVTVYRELRRAALRPDRLTPETPADLVAAADLANWAEFTRLMGGANLPRRLRPARVWYAATTQVTMREKMGRYGDKLKCLWGVIGEAFATMSRFTEWIVSAGSHAAGAAGKLFTLCPPPTTPTAEGFI